MAALKPWECNLTGDGEPERLGGARVSSNFFSFLGVPVAHGRGFVPTEEQPGNDRVVISDALWRRRYAADPGLIGRSISINGVGHFVVGIAFPSLLVPTQSLLHPLLAFAPRIDIWKPIAPSKQDLEGESWDHGLLVRLRPGDGAERGRHQLEVILNAMIRAQFPKMSFELKTQLVPIREVYAGKVRLRLLLIFAASSLLLLTACSNIANLFLARAASRVNEYATRLVLGATRTRILSQVLAETSVLAIIGGVLGALIAGYGAALLSSYGPADVRLLAYNGLNLPVFSFAMLGSLTSGIGCGLLSAWRLGRKDPVQGLREGARTTLGGRASVRSREFLVGMQMALGTALLASAALLLHSFVKVMSFDRGYYIERVLAVDLSLAGTRQDSAVFYRQLSENVRTIPGVLAAGAINDLPAGSGQSGSSRTIFHPTDTDMQSVVLQRPVAMIRSVTGGYFAASGTRLQAGRFLTDHEPALVALISESLARRLWPRENSAAIIGRTLRQGNVVGPLITVVGVAQDVRPGVADRELPPMIYRPYAQWPSGPAMLVLRTAEDSTALVPVVRAEIRKMNPNIPIPAMRTMREIISASVAQRRFQMTLTSLFALLALLVGAVGIYGVVSYSVACRTRDIGLRIALGAVRTDVMRWVLLRGMRPVIIGVIVGLCAAIAIAVALRSLLFGITPTDPISLGSVVLVVMVTSVLACYLPARRAASLDPILALRHE